MGNDAFLPHALSLSLSNLFRCSVIGSGGLNGGLIGSFVGPGGFFFGLGFFRNRWLIPRHGFLFFGRKSSFPLTDRPFRIIIGIDVYSGFCVRSSQIERFRALNFNFKLLISPFYWSLVQGSKNLNNSSLSLSLLNSLNFSICRFHNLISF